MPERKGCTLRPNTEPPVQSIPPTRATLQMRLVGGTHVVTGELDAEFAGELERVLGLLSAPSGGVRDLTDLRLDLEQVRAIDRAGLRALVTASKAAAASGRHLAISPSEAV